jgi:hypothetical protein
VGARGRSATGRGRDATSVSHGLALRERGRWGYVVPAEAVQPPDPRRVGADLLRLRLLTGALARAPAVVESASVTANLATPAPVGAAPKHHRSPAGGGEAEERLDLRTCVADYSQVGGGFVVGGKQKGGGADGVWRPAFPIAIYTGNSRFWTAAWIHFVGQTIDTKTKTPYQSKLTVSSPIWSVCLHLILFRQGGHVK